MRRFIAALAFWASPVSAAGFPVSADDLLVQQGRPLIAREHPEVIKHMARNDGFGGSSSPAIARAMLSDAPELVAEARRKMVIEPQGPGLWLIRFPYVNVAVLETRDSLVLFDSGYAAIGPVLRDVLPTLSKKPLKTIILSHTHVDHSYGARTLVTQSPRPTVIASAEMRQAIATDLRLGGSIGRYNNQPLALQPTSLDDVVVPDVTFEGRRTFHIGGEEITLIHAPGETEDQIWMWLPKRKTIITADYVQGFLPNAGNGKRMQRYVEEWAAALHEMAALKPERLLPMHGAAVQGSAQIGRALTTYATALDHIVAQTITRLNAGDRKDAIAASIDWPERFAKDPLLDPQYNRPEDIARMVMKRWTGWWDDVPSHFAALPFEAEAQEALRLAGGLDALDARARALLPTQPMLAARLADWAYYGAPDTPKALRLAIDVYIARLLEPNMPVQEGLIYLDMASKARAKLANLEKAAAP
jgi:glyoxylase-like metal-dependent hydrolase (beta-lactamase superfamily II)